MILLLIIYLVSAALLWLYFHLAHSKGGIYYLETTIGSEALIVFVPIINTIMVFFLWVFYYPKKQSKITANKFFKIK